MYILYSHVICNRCNIYLCISCFINAIGLSGLRLIKVVIPAYKLRGESTYLECQYELNRPNSSTSSSIYNSNSNIKMNVNNGYQQHSRSYQHQRYHQQHQHQQQHQNQNQDQDQQQQEQQEQESYYHEDQNIYKIYEEQVLRSHHYTPYDNIDEHHQNDGSEALYAIKWYKDNEEFYRYVPKANPPKQSYQVDGIRVDVSISIQYTLIFHRHFRHLHIILIIIKILITIISSIIIIIIGLHMYIHTHKVDLFGYILTILYYYTIYKDEFFFLSFTFQFIKYT